MNKISEILINRLDSFINQEPEIIFQWNDNKSPAVGYLVINSLRGNAAGGGTRVHGNVSMEEIKTLAKIMEMKFAICGPNIGGAKSGIRIHSSSNEKYHILERWYKAIKPILQNYYGTGSDLNTDITAIGKILAGIGINHTQEGVIHAFSKGATHKKNIIISNMKILENKSDIGVKVSSAVTGFGVACSLKYFYKNLGTSLKNKRVYIEGAGNVGAAAALYLHKMGARIVAISDHLSGVINNNGISIEDIKTISAKKLVSSIDLNMIKSDFNIAIEKINVDIFIPAAASNLVTRSFIDKLIANGLEVISSGANHPFSEIEYCYGSLTQHIDNHISLIPDFIANSGMARSFYFLMNNKDINIDNLFDDIDCMMGKFVKNCFDMYDGRYLCAAAYNISLDRMKSK